MGTDLELVPGAALELEAKSWWVAGVENVFALQPMKRQEQTQAARLDLYYRILPGPLLQEAVVEIQFQVESMLVDLLLSCWQEPPEQLQGERAHRQVQDQDLLLGQGLTLWLGLQQEGINYFQLVEACPGLSPLSVSSRGKRWG